MKAQVKVLYRRELPGNMDVSAVQHLSALLLLSLTGGFRVCHFFFFFFSV